MPGSLLVLTSDGIGSFARHERDGEEESQPSLLLAYSWAQNISLSFHSLRNFLPSLSLWELCVTVKGSTARSGETRAIQSNISAWLGVGPLAITDGSESSRWKVFQSAASYMSRSIWLPLNDLPHFGRQAVGTARCLAWEGRAHACLLLYSATKARKKEKKKPNSFSSGRLYCRLSSPTSLQFITSNKPDYITTAPFLSSLILYYSFVARHITCRSLLPPPFPPILIIFRHCTYYRI